MVGASEKAAHLTRQLLAYAGKGRFLAEPIDLSLLIRENENLLRTSIPKSIQVRLQLEDRLPAIVGDPSQFQQLIMNLLINAAEAIGTNRSGLVVVVAKSLLVERDGQTGNEGQVAPGMYVSLEVRDNGSGMDEETRSKIFDPFSPRSSRAAGSVLRPP